MRPSNGTKLQDNQNGGNFSLESSRSEDSIAFTGHDVEEGNADALEEEGDACDDPGCFGHFCGCDIRFVEFCGKVLNGFKF